MDLKLNIQKRGLTANTEVVNEEYTLAFGHIFRGTPAYKITHSELKAKRDAGQLVAGAFYRITDYETTTSQSNTQSAGHPFDIIVQALTNSTLSEEAHAAPREGDTYLANSNLAAWKLRYTLDNDTTRFAWAKKAVAERAQSWTAGWGVLESKNNAEASTNYTTAVVDGRTKYLYAPAERGTYLDSKTFYRNILAGSITSPDGFIYEADYAPTDEGDDYWNWEEVSEIRVKTADGKQVATFINSYDNVFVDASDDMGDYSIAFSNDYTEVDGVFHFTPESGIEDWWDNVVGGSIDTYEKEYYNGSTSALYYAFDSILPKSNRAVTEVYSTETKKVYESDDLNDTVKYISYIAPVEGGKGVIYRMVDENGNDCPYDFKNIQHNYNGTYHYTFEKGGADYSLNKACVRNVITSLYANKIMRVVFEVLSTSTAFALRDNLLDVEVSNVFYIVAERCERNVWRKGEQWNMAKSDYSTFLYNPTRTNARAFVANILNGVTHSLTISENQRECIYYLAGGGNGQVTVTMSQKQCISNVYDFRNNVDSSRTISISGAACRYSRLRIINGSFVNNMVLARSVVEASQSLTLSTGTTTSTNYSVQNLRVQGIGWTSAENITIVSTFPTNAEYSLTIAKNSAGEIKQWCEADLV